VNFAVRRFPGYGKLSGKSLDELRAGERVAVLDDKEDPLDFVLWKSAKPDEPDDAKWPSRLRPGPPGLAHRVLGHELRAAGRALRHPRRWHGPAVPAPRERDCAERRRNGGPFVNTWMHNGFSTSTTRRCPSRWATSSPSPMCSSASTARRCASSCCARTTAARSTSATRCSTMRAPRCKRLYTALQSGRRRGRSARHRLGRTACRRLQGGDGRRLQHAGRGGRAVRPGRRQVNRGGATATPRC
jgi:hypothetical protein